LPEIVDHDKSGYVVEVNSLAVSEALSDFFKNDRSQGMTKATIQAKARFSWKMLLEALSSI
jgi:glycosyltransferase involved in cell wall biosynthesis